MNNFRQSDGFTFVELVLVVSLLSVLLLFSIPVFRNISPLSDDSSNISKLVFLIESLKQKAVREGSNFFLHIDTDSRRIWVTSDSMDEQAKENALNESFSLDDGIILLSIEFIPARQQENNHFSICFDPRGYSDQALIHLRENDEDITLRISTFLARVERYNRYLSYDDCI